MNDTQVTEKFAQALVAHVRDKAISTASANLDPEIRTTCARRWTQATALGDVHEQLHTIVIPDVVDQTIFHLLKALENELLDLGVKSSAGEWTSLSHLFAFEAAGEFIGNDGWRERYSSATVNNFA